MTMEDNNKDKPLNLADLHQVLKAVQTDEALSEKDKAYIAGHIRDDIDNLESQGADINAFYDP